MWTHRDGRRSLVLGAEDDRIVPPGLQRELHHALPESALHILPDGGHFFPRTRAPAMARCVEAWLDNGDPGAPPAMPQRSTEHE